MAEIIEPMPPNCLAGETGIFENCFTQASYCMDLPAVLFATEASKIQKPP
jgi:hypothetical protein